MDSESSSEGSPWESEDSIHASASPDVWGSAVVNGDEVKLSKMVLEWSHSKPEVALSLLRRCVALMEKDVADCVDDPGLPSSPTSLQGSSLDSCLDAFTVVLNQTCEGKNWRMSTRELQLASLPFCCACRSVTTLTLMVKDDVPRRLLAAADAPPPNRKRLCSSRVPRLRAREVWWYLPTAAELRRPIYSLADATEIYFYGDFVDSLEDVIWPRRLKGISFCGDSRCDRPLDEVTWPASLQKLGEMGSVHKSMSTVRLPSSLQELTFGREFDQPITGTTWPTTLLIIGFGYAFNQPIEQVTWPDSVRQLSFGKRFDRPVKGVRWPASLQQLSFGWRFNRPLKGVVWPASIRQIRFGDAFNQPIEGVAWADSITHLSFGRRFNQPVERVKWPASLHDLSFGFFVDCPHDGISLGSSWFNHPVDRARWPTSLRRLHLGRRFKCSLKGLGSWMPNLEELRLLSGRPLGYKNLSDGVQWPAGLRKLTVFRGYRFESVREHVPQSVQIVYCNRG